MTKRVLIVGAGGHGRSLAEAAGTMGISIATARHYLKAIFAKTETARQSELVALLAKHAS